MYICLEGIDGSGKTTQIKLLGEWIRDYGLEAWEIFEPTDSPTGKLIREMLKNPKATELNFQRTLGLLFAADRMVLMEEIAKAEKELKVIISDRSFYSSLVYQDNKEWIAAINRYVRRPDLVIILDLDTEVALSRCEGKDHFENREFLHRIRKKYLTLAQDEDFFVVNANNGINKVHEDIKKIVSPRIGRCI